MERRRDLASILRRHGALAIEDDVYWQLRYEGPSVPALWSYAPENVIYLSSLSKTFAPAIRAGIVVMPKEFRDAALRIKQGMDMHTSMLGQAVASEFLIGAESVTHVELLRVAYRKKRDQLLDALQNYFPPSFHWVRPQGGGLFVWVSGPPELDSSALLPAAIKAKVAYMPGVGFHADPVLGGANTMRLSFASGPADSRPSVVALAEIVTRGGHGW